jgi:hypothetical protein
LSPGVVHESEEGFLVGLLLTKLFNSNVGVGGSPSGQREQAKYETLQAQTILVSWSGER